MTNSPLTDGALMIKHISMTLVIKGGELTDQERDKIKLVRAWGIENLYRSIRNTPNKKEIGGP